MLSLELFAFLIQEYIEYLKQTGTINVRSGFWNTTIDFGNVVIDVAGATSGFIIGLVEVFFSCNMGSFRRDNRFNISNCWCFQEIYFRRFNR